MYGEKMASIGTGPEERPEAIGRVKGPLVRCCLEPDLQENSRGYLFYPKQKLQNIALKTQVYLFWDEWKMGTLFCRGQRK